MWFECSECGGHVERLSAPTSCPICGTAGVIFVPAERGNYAESDPDALPEGWLYSGLETPPRAMHHVYGEDADDHA